MSRTINVTEIVTNLAGDQEISNQLIGTITVDEDNVVTDTTVADKLPNISIGQTIESTELFVTTIQEAE